MIETARGTVHEWQRDHMGHINVRAYMEFFEEACWQFYAMLGLTAVEAAQRRPAPGRRAAEHRYRRSCIPGDTIAVRTGVLELREKVLRFRHELCSTPRPARWPRPASSPWSASTGRRASRAPFRRSAPRRRAA
jgi:acyl-CoA thioester hydrolase